MLFKLNSHLKHSSVTAEIKTHQTVVCKIARRWTKVTLSVRVYFGHLSDANQQMHCWAS